MPSNFAERRASSSVTSVGATFDITTSRSTMHFTMSDRGRQVVHHVEHRLLDDRAQAAGAGVPLQRFVGDLRRARRR